MFRESGTKFGESYNDACDFLRERFGNNASGAVGVYWKGGLGGHVFNWDIKDSKVKFYDTYGKFDSEFIKNAYWQAIEPEAPIEVARLDGLTINFDGLRRIIE